MKTWMLSLWAWIMAHPEQVFGAIAAILTAIAAATVANARAKGRPVGWFPRFVDRLAVRTRANATNAGWSWPIIGRSAFEAAIDASAPPSDPPPASGGFSEVVLMRWIAGVSMLVIFAVTCCGCPMPAPDGCTPFATRCSPSGIPETCSQSQRWSHAPPATPCSSRGPVVCCWTRSPYGRELHACVPESACLPETGDAGVEVSDAE